MRTTRKQLEGTLSRLCSALGQSYLTETPKGSSGLFLDHTPGGYIVRRVNPDTTQSDVFGSELRSANEMWSTMAFAIQAVGLIKRGE